MPIQRTRARSLFVTGWLPLALLFAACVAPATPVPEEEEPPQEEEVVELPTATDTVAPPDQPLPTPTATETELPPEPTPTPTPTLVIIDLSAYLDALDGDIDAETRVIWDIAQHFDFIQLPVNFTLKVQTALEADDVALSLTGEGTWVPLRGGFVLAENDGPRPADRLSTLFEANGVGTVAGFPNVSVSMLGVFADEELEAFVRFGTRAELPTGASALYQLTGPWVVPPLLPFDLPAETETVEEAVTNLVNLFTEGDAAAILGVTDPLALAYYGLAQCQAFVAQAPADLPADLMLSDPAAFGPGTVELDGQPMTFDNVLQMPVQPFQIGDTPVDTLILRQIGQQIYWVPACGVSLP